VFPTIHGVNDIFLVGQDIAKSRKLAGVSSTIRTLGFSLLFAITRYSHFRRFVGFSKTSLGRASSLASWWPLHAYPDTPCSPIGIRYVRDWHWHLHSSIIYASEAERNNTLF